MPLASDSRDYFVQLLLLLYYAGCSQLTILGNPSYYHKPEMHRLGERHYDSTIPSCLPPSLVPQ